MKYTCSQCHEEYDAISLASFGDDWVCERCKDTYVQCLKEGVSLNAKQPASPSKPVYIGGQIFGLAIVSFFVAASILGAFMLGPIGFLAAPILVLFGWFFFPLVVINYAIAWFVWGKTEMSRMNFSLCFSGITALLFAMISIREEGKELQGILGFGLGAFIPCYISVWILTGNRINKVEQTPELRG